MSNIVEFHQNLSALNLKLFIQDQFSMCQRKSCNGDRNIDPNREEYIEIVHY